MRVLLVEDDAPVAAGIEAGLALSDFVVDTVTTLDSARGALSAIDYDAVVLARRLPDGEADPARSAGQYSWRAPARTATAGAI